jgi:hypothetical protein
LHGEILVLSIALFPAGSIAGVVLIGECGAVSASAAMEGNGEAGELAPRGGEREMANPAAQGAAERRMEDGDVPVAPDDEIVVVEALSGRKRKRDEEQEPEAEGSQQAAERLSAATPVQQPPTLAPAPRPLQRLLDACRAAFGVASAPPMASIVHQIRGIMGTCRTC